MALLLRVTNVNNDVHLIGMMKIKRFVLNVRTRMFSLTLNITDAHRYKTL